MKNTNKFLNKFKKIFQTILIFFQIPFIILLHIEQIKFILYELRRLNEHIRLNSLRDKSNLYQDSSNQTCSSFNYQWEKFNYGNMLPNDQDFMRTIDDYISNLTDIDIEWFNGKKILDIGCGTGRFTYGFLKMGAYVCAVDQSDWALKCTSELCKQFSNKLICKHTDILEWNKKDKFDFVFAYGVVHHTGNTYQAIINTANKVKNNGGKLFLMVYGFPEFFRDFIELNKYEDLRSELRNFPIDNKKQVLIDRFGPEAHGFFDAVSPRINDLLTFTEIEELLINLGFINIRKTIINRNHHIIAEKT